MMSVSTPRPSPQITPKFLNDITLSRKMYDIQQTFDDLTKVEGSTYCMLCLETLDNPAALDCEHVFCHSCLGFYYALYSNVKYEQHGVFVPCPTCRKLTKVPDDGLSELIQDEQTQQDRMRKISMASDGSAQRCDVCLFKNKVEEAIYYCSKCAMNLCEVCKKAHYNQSLLKSHSVIHITNKETINLYCTSHTNLLCHYFCLDCNVPVCNVCLILSHNTHHAVKLRDALGMRRENLKTLLNSFGPKLDKLDARVKKLSHMTYLHSKKQNGLLHPPSPKASVRVPINGISDDLITIETQLRSYQCHLERLHRLYDMASKILEISQSKKLLAIYDDILNRIQTVLELELQYLQDDIEARIEKELESVNELIMQIAPSSSTNSLIDRANSQSSTDGSSMDDAVFEQSLQPSMLITPKLLWKVEKYRHEPGELWNPCDITFLEDGKVVVAEYDIVNNKNNRLQIFDNTGKSLSVIAQDQIQPLGVTATREGNIAVTDCKGKRVKIFTPSGHLMQEMGKGHFGWPYGIAVNSKGQIIVSDAFSDTIDIFSPDGKRLKQFGSSGCNNMQFRNPYHITVDSADNILVSDSGNNCIKAFDSAGQFMFRSTVESGSGSDRKRRSHRLKAPRGIGTDLKGNILVADDCSRVCMFDSNGKFIRNLLTKEDMVKYPEAIATSGKGQLAVTEWNPSNMFAVKIFNMYE